jgi:hypothetical protein
MWDETLRPRPPSPTKPTMPKKRAQTGDAATNPSHVTT